MELLNFYAADSNLMDWRLQRQTRLTQWIIGLIFLFILLILSSLWRWQHYLQLEIIQAQQKIQINNRVAQNPKQNKAALELYDLLISLQNNTRNSIVFKSMVVNKNDFYLSAWAKNSQNYDEFMQKIKANKSLANLHLKNLLYLNAHSTIFFEIEGVLAYASRSA